MRRGTTPTITFICPFAVDNATKVSVVFAQYDEIILKKALSGCSISGKRISIHLTENETLNFNCKKDGVDMQIRIELDGEKMASNIMHTTVDKILKDGCL